jgi:hypothetical protein
MFLYIEEQKSAVQILMLLLLQRLTLKFAPAGRKRYYIDCVEYLVRIQEIILQLRILENNFINARQPRINCQSFSSSTKHIHSNKVELMTLTIHEFS